MKSIDKIINNISRHFKKHTGHWLVLSAFAFVLLGAINVFSPAVTSAQNPPAPTQMGPNYYDPATIITNSPVDGHYTSTHIADRYNRYSTPGNVIDWATILVPHPAANGNRSDVSAKCNADGQKITVTYGSPSETREVSTNNSGQPLSCTPNQTWSAGSGLRCRELPGGADGTWWYMNLVGELPGHSPGNANLFTTGEICNPPTCTGSNGVGIGGAIYQSEEWTCFVPASICASGIMTNAFAADPNDPFGCLNIWTRNYLPERPEPLFAGDTQVRCREVTAALPGGYYTTYYQYYLPYADTNTPAPLYTGGSIYSGWRKVLWGGIVQETIDLGTTASGQTLTQTMTPLEILTAIVTGQKVYTAVHNYQRQHFIDLRQSLINHVRNDPSQLDYYFGRIINYTHEIAGMSQENQTTPPVTGAPFTGAYTIPTLQGDGGDQTGMTVIQNSQIVSNECTPPPPPPTPCESQWNASQRGGSSGLLVFYNNANPRVYNASEQWAADNGFCQNMCETNHFGGIWDNPAIPSCADTCPSGTIFDSNLTQCTEAPLSVQNNTCITITPGSTNFDGTYIANPRVCSTINNNKYPDPTTQILDAFRTTAGTLSSHICSDTVNGSLLTVEKDGTSGNWQKWKIKRADGQKFSDYDAFTISCRKASDAPENRFTIQMRVDQPPVVIDAPDVMGYVHRTTAHENALFQWITDRNVPCTVKNNSGGNLDGLSNITPIQQNGTSWYYQVPLGQNNVPSNTNTPFGYQISCGATTANTQLYLYQTSVNTGGDQAYGTLTATCPVTFGQSSCSPAYSFRIDTPTGGNASIKQLNYRLENTYNSHSTNYNASTVNSVNDIRFLPENPLGMGQTQYRLYIGTNVSFPIKNGTYWNKGTSVSSPDFSGNQIDYTTQCITGTTLINGVCATSDSTVNIYGVDQNDNGCTIAFGQSTCTAETSWGTTGYYAAELNTCKKSPWEGNGSCLNPTTNSNIIRANSVGEIGPLYTTLTGVPYKFEKKNDTSPTYIEARLFASTRPEDINPGSTPDYGTNPRLTKNIHAVCGTLPNGNIELEPLYNNADNFAKCWCPQGTVASSTGGTQTCIQCNTQNGGCETTCREDDPSCNNPETKCTNGSLRLPNCDIGLDFTGGAATVAAPVMTLDRPTQFTFRWRSNVQCDIRTVEGLAIPGRIGGALASTSLPGTDLKGYAFTIFTGEAPTAPNHPNYAEDQGGPIFTQPGEIGYLLACGEGNDATTTILTAQLFDITGQVGMPDGYTLTAPAGASYYTGTGAAVCSVTSPSGFIGFMLGADWKLRIAGETGNYANGDETGLTYTAIATYASGQASGTMNSLGGSVVLNDLQFSPKSQSWWGSQLECSYPYYDYYNAVVETKRFTQTSYYGYTINRANSAPDFSSPGLEYLVDPSRDPNNSNSTTIVWKARLNTTTNTCSITATDYSTGNSNDVLNTRLMGSIAQSQNSPGIPMTITQAFQDGSQGYVSGSADVGHHDKSTTFTLTCINSERPNEPFTTSATILKGVDAEY